jgi:hypothetical protein
MYDIAARHKFFPKNIYCPRLILFPDHKLLPERGNFFSKLSQLAFLATTLVPVGNIFRIPPIRLNRTKSFYDPLFAFQKNFSSLSFYIQGLRPVVTTLTTRPNFFISKSFPEKIRDRSLIFFWAPRRRSNHAPCLILDSPKSKYLRIYALKQTKTAIFLTTWAKIAVFAPCRTSPNSILTTKKTPYSSL